MQKTILLGLANFQPGAIPNSLLAPVHGAAQAPLDQISVPIRRLCHHMFIDTYGQVPPAQNPLFQLHSSFLTNAASLEYIVNSLGSHKEAKNAESMRLGKAFCRLFLDEHFQFTYFGHMDHLLGKAALPQYGNVRVIRAAQGNTPDYLCADSQDRIFLAEAKGQQTGTIAFANPTFTEWRQQFNKVHVLTAQGGVKRVKGYVVATRFKIENQANTASKLFAEDPVSPGTSDLTANDAETVAGFRRMVIHSHFSTIFDILGLSLQAAALRLGILLPTEESVIVGLWRCPLPPLDKLRFVGGYLPSYTQADSSGSRPWWFDPSQLLDLFNFSWRSNEMRWLLKNLAFGWNPNLNSASQTFFGVESQTFKGVLQETRSSDAALTVHALDLANEALPEQISILRDGTIIAPASFMRLEEVVVM